MQFLHNNGKLMTKIKNHTKKYINNPQAKNSYLKKELQNGFWCKFYHWEPDSDHY